MTRLLKWLSDEAHGWQMVLLMIGGVALSLLYCFTAVYLMKRMGVAPVNSSGGSEIEIMTWYFIPTIIIFAAYEELWFRYPLSLAVAGWGACKKIIVVAVISSVIFGFLHGKSINLIFIHGSIQNIFLQGVGGIIFCLLYLKCGGLAGKWLKPLIVSTLTHAAYNGTLAIITLLAGGKYL